MAIIHIHGTLIFFFILHLNFSLTSSISDSEALLKLKESFTNANGLDSWQPGTEPCANNNQWIGIICENGVVSGLRLGNSGLSGKIDIDALVSISGLRSIAIMSDSFSGPIPDFNRIGALKGLYITDNQFSGEIPENYFAEMKSLKKVWLSGNKFSGRIPYSLVELSNLMELHLESNQFSGTIPPLQQQSLISLNLSNNNLEGEIPQGLSRFTVEAFNGNAGLCGEKLTKPCDPSKRAHHSAKAVRIAICVLVAVVAVLLVMVVAIFVMRRRNECFDVRKRGKHDSGGKMDFESLSRKGMGLSHRIGSSIKGRSTHGKGVGDLVILNDENGEFGLPDLMKAAAEVLGNGALGSSYKATMASGLTVVVKRVKEMTKMGKDQFDSEMRRLGRLQHKNVLTPLAYHYRKDEKLLVYEYKPKGSLLLLLHGGRGICYSELNWDVRFKVIQGIANGLGYIHTELSSLDLPHGDLKSSNVLLTKNYDPLLCDYGFCSLLSCSQAAEALTAYKSPEAILDRQISPKCDVYCLGILILEILTGQFPSQYLSNGKGGTDLVQWVRSAISEGRESELVDPDVPNAAFYVDEIGKLLHVGAACTENNPDERLDIGEAIRRIEGIVVEGSNNQDTKTGFDVHQGQSLRDGYIDESEEIDRTQL